MAGRHHSEAEDGPASGGVPKVPAVKPYFWVLKLLSTAMGEAMSDFVVLDVNKYLGVILGFVVFAAAIVWQFRTPRYGTWPYWTAVSMVAVFGTMAADVMHVVLGVPYMMSAAFYAICLTVTFVAWYRSEGTLDIHSIVTRRREAFYWLAVIFTFAMGTALGDLFATTFTLGYLASAFAFIALICVPLVAWRLGASPVLTFWVAYILTRPIGASFADFFGMPKDISGMGYGHGAVSVVTLILVLALIGYVARTGIDAPETAAAGLAEGRLAAARASAVGGPAAFPGTACHPAAGAMRRDPPYAARWDQEPAYGPPWDREPAYRDSQYQGPAYGDSRHRNPRHPGPQYQDPAYGDPRYRDPAYSDPQYRREPQYPYLQQ